MAVYQPLELHDENGEPTGLWHYTVTDGGGTRAAGHCSPWEKCPQCNGTSFWRVNMDCEKCANRGVVRKVDPCPGHPTSDEAIRHYQQYLFDKARYDGHSPDHQRKCKVCGVWTPRFAVVQEYDIFPLCGAHNNPDGLAQVFPF